MPVIARRPSFRADAKATKAPAGRRDEIVGIAAKLFAERGFGATTIREIADEARILSGSIYHHFDTKDEILHEVIRDAVMLMRDATIRISKSDSDAEHKLVALILLAIDMHAKDHQAHAILYNDRKLLRHKRGFEYVAHAKGDMYLAWRSVLQEGVEARLFRVNLDLFLTITTVIRMLNTCADWFHQDRIFEMGGEPYQRDQVVDFNLRFILCAVRYPGRVSAPVPRAESEALIQGRL
jgi:AcrR family transcriptional regulator